MALLRTWPALTISTNPGETTFTAAGTAILRLTGPSTAHLHLTRPAIERLHHLLPTPERPSSPTDSGWITLHLTTTTDLELLLALISIAIKAHA
ncbi:hypothetical protein Aph01nite_18270 [Acrocarpospora phusangensis]|uniref:Luciferase domain-containing protein n=1 Tax=Acrocarpospora phusangensis TaxID=1070424 RepID=A0A919QBY5_9ACTN|nr:luciferase family protein [Acrocarpospora phusangensis]GIH23517.1 hypothetical protein Aph01nite_18270 [Acrocarpospora phusangensis]